MAKVAGRILVCPSMQNGGTVGTMDQDYGAVVSVAPGEDQVGAKELRRLRITSRS
jgi:hypothetical protein